jgi:hypothetical protein
MTEFGREGRESSQTRVFVTEGPLGGGRESLEKVILDRDSEISLLLYSRSRLSTPIELYHFQLFRVESLGALPIKTRWRANAKNTRDGYTKRIKSLKQGGASGNGTLQTQENLVDGLFGEWPTFPREPGYL